MLAALRRRLGQPERGSISEWLALASVVMIIVVGLAVDLAGQVHAQQHARDVAAQAARVGGQQLAAPQAVRGMSVETDPYQAIQAARSYLSASDISGTVRMVDGTTLVVTTSDIYHPKFLSIVGLNSMRVTGESEARVVRVVGGAEG